MATALANVIEEFDEIEEFPDVPTIEEFDEPTPNVVGEAARATTAALQARDLMAAPTAWANAAVNEISRRRAAAQELGAEGDRVRSELSKITTYRSEEQRADRLSSGYYAAARREADQADALESQLASELGARDPVPIRKALQEEERQSILGAWDRANWMGSGLAEIAKSAGLRPLASDIEGLGRTAGGVNFQANIGAAAGGAIGAGLMMMPGGQALGARTLAQMAAPIVAPMMGGVGGSMAGGVIQEEIQQASETPEETQARQEVMAQTRQESPVASMIGASLANAPFMRPSLSQFSEAMAGNRTAMQSLGAAAAIGGATGALPSVLGSQPISLAQIAQSAMENMIFNKPTRLGRALGLPAAETTQPTQTDAQQINETGTLDGGVRPPEVPSADVTLPAAQSGEGVQPSRQGESLAEAAPTQTREVNAPPQQEQVAEVSGPETVETSQPAGTPEAPAAPETTTPVVEDLGGAVPVAPVASAEGQPTGIRNAIVDPARAEAGIPPRELPLARSFPQIHEEARAALANDPQAGVRLVSELTENIRPLTDTEDAVLTFEQNVREQERTAAVDAVNNATDPDARDAAIARLAEADNKLFEVYQVGQQAGTANARGLNARRLMQNQDFTLSKMLNEKRAIENNGEPLSREQTAEVEALHKRISELETKLAGTEAKEARTAAQNEYRRILRETKREAGEAAKSKRSITDFMTDAAEKARQRIIARRGRLQVTVDPLNIAGLVDEAIIGASYVAKGIRDAAEWSKQMLSEFGERIRPHLDALFAKASAMADDTAKTFTANQPATPEQILGNIKDGAKLEQRVVYDLARAHVNSGMDDFNQVMTRVTEDLKPRYPEITERQVMDALSGYGKISTPSKEADLKQLREFKNLARLTAQLQDAQSKIPPKKTGLQRDKASAKVRELQKQVNAAIRAAGFTRTSPESQLATAHTARVTRLKNAIEETQQAIETGKRPDRPNPVPWTPEEVALRDQLNELKTRLDDALNEPDNAKLQGLLRRIEDVSQRLKSGDIGVRPRNQGPDTKEVAQAKDDLAKLNKELSDLRKAQREKENPPKTPDEKRLAALEKQRDELFARVSKGDISTRTGKPTVDTAEQSKLRAEIELLNRQMAEMRKAARPQKPADEAQFKSLQKRLAAAQARLASGDITPTPRGRPTVDTARVAQARSELDAVNHQINELRANSEELRLNRDKTRIQNQIREIEGRISRGDYEPRVRKEPAMDREKLEAQYELSKVKEKWNQGLIEAKRAARPLGQKIFEGVGEGINLARQLVTSGDFPPVFRQGLFAIGRPITTAKAVADSFKAMVSEKQRFKIMQEIENRPNAPLYSRSKLYLAKDTAQPLSQMEENFMGNWFKQLPRWTIVGPLLRASERSYNTFLNKLRADTFDSAVKLFNISETDTASLRALAANVNTFTGRSTLPGRALEQGAPALNTLLFAPRFMMSRFKVAVGQPLWGGTAKSRLAALDTYARTLGGIAVIYALGKMAGGEIETDPRSSDFGKIKMGQTRLDPLGGLSQITTFLTRVTTGETKTGKGHLVPLRETSRPLEGTSVGAKGKPNMIVGGTGDVLKNFLRSKLNPAAGTVWNLVEGKDITGKPVTPASTLVNTTVPISYQDILSTMEKQGIPRGAALFTLSLFGMGLNTYEDRKK